MLPRPIAQPDTPLLLNLSKYSHHMSQVVLFCIVNAAYPDTNRAYK